MAWREVAGGSTKDEDRIRFSELQKRLGPLFSRIFPDPTQPRTVVVLPSLTVDQETLFKVKGAHHYEERMLCMLMLLRLPRTHIIYLTSEVISEAVIDYYLNLLPGIPSTHARRRLALLACHDSSPRPLTEKILERPRLIERIRAAIPNIADAHLACFTVTSLERELALRLEVPIFGCDPELLRFGTKSGGRELLREAGVPVPMGFENLSTPENVRDALLELKRKNPALRRAAVKLNEGFSGEGNAVFSFVNAPKATNSLRRWISESLLHELRFEAANETWENFLHKLGRARGIVEEFIEGDEKRSPSVQFRIDPLGTLEEISTHDQVLGGPSGQLFLGCAFPADEEYRADIQRLGRLAGERLLDAGVLGRFAIDFISVRENDGWRHYAIEINLRKGGTTHPFLMLQFLTDGRYDKESGLYYTPSDLPRYYFASDNLQSERYRGLTPADLIDIAVLRGLHFHGATQQGVVFHLIGALSEFGKLGVVCVGDSPVAAQRLYDQAVAVLDEEGWSQAENTDPG